MRSAILSGWYRYLVGVLLLIVSVIFVQRWTLKCMTTNEESAVLALVGNRASLRRSRNSRTGGYTFPSLPELTTPSEMIACRKGLQILSNKLENEMPSQSIRKIPRMIHQTSKSVCVTKKVANATQQWRNWTGFSYFFHDDNAIRKLFDQDFPEFPHIRMVVDNCVVYGTLGADLWRYLVLWQYGGIYADLDAVPAKFDPETSIGSDDDAFFVVEQYHLLSQWFMAVSPRHPIMFYAVHHSLANLLKAADTGTIPGMKFMSHRCCIQALIASIEAPLFTGPHALHSAYRDFRRDGGDYIETAVPGNKPVEAGRFVGTNNRTITIVGVASNQNEIVNRDVLKGTKLREYAKMGMRHFQDDKKIATGTSCLHSVFVKSILES